MISRHTTRPCHFSASRDSDGYIRVVTRLLCHSMESWRVCFTTPCTMLMSFPVHRIAAYGFHHSMDVYALSHGMSCLHLSCNGVCVCVCLCCALSVVLRGSQLVVWGQHWSAVSDEASLKTFSSCALFDRSHPRSSPGNGDDTIFDRATFSSFCASTLLLLLFL